jgi:glucose uptake protein GlcU
VMNWGVLPGAVLGLVNYLFFFTYRYSPIVTPRIRNIDDAYDSLLVSLDAAFTEEVIYRLFVISTLLFMFDHLYRNLKHVWPALVALVPRAMAMVLSALAFAIVHDLYGFTAAFLAGIILGFIYLRSGIESAIAAHFVANFLFFSASYLS